MSIGNVLIEERRSRYGGRRRAAALALLSGFAQAGCAVGPDYVEPKPLQLDRVTSGPIPAATVGSAGRAGATQRLVSGRDIRGDWWTLLHSPRIDALVAEALRNSPTLAAAQATLREAKENVRAEQGSLLPTVSGSASDEREKESLAGFGENGSVLYTLYSGSLSVSYTLDVFGGTRRQIEQLAAEADYQQAELEAAYLSLTANVVTTALDEASYQAQIEATEDIIRTDQQQLDVTRRRFELGGVSQADVLSQQSTLASAVATMPPLRKELEQQRNQLAAYLGVAPSQVSGPPVDLGALILPAELPTAVPSQIVAQRPDVRAYAAEVHSASADVGVAIANMLPQISLTGSYGREGTNLSDLFTPSGLIWSLAAQLTQPIFEGGTLRAKRRAADAALAAAAADYSATIASAFQDVANAITAVVHDAETLQADVEAERVAGASLAITRAQYQAGGNTYVAVLQAEQSYQNARLTLVAAQAARFTDSVALFQALGGGWWHRTDVASSVSHCCGLLP